MRFVFTDPHEKGRRKPADLIADVEVVFEESEGPLLAGLKLVGLGLWRQGDEIRVTLPSRRVQATEPGAKDWSYDFLRAEDGPEAAQRIREFRKTVLDAYLLQPSPVHA